MKTRATLVAVLACAALANACSKSSPAVKDDAPEPAAEGKTDKKTESGAAPAPAAEGFVGTWKVTTLAISDDKPHGDTAMFNVEIPFAKEDGGRVIKVTRAPAGGKPRLSGTAVATEAATDEDTDSARWLNFDVTLEGGGEKLPMHFELRIDGAEMTGYWDYTGDPWVDRIPDVPGAYEAKVYGALLGKRGDSAPALSRATTLPCMTCCTVLYRCGPQGPGACNSSMTCIGECAAPNDGGKPHRPDACLAR